MSDMEARLAARVASKLKQANTLWEGATWREYVDIGRADLEDLTPIQLQKRAKIELSIRAIRAEIGDDVDMDAPLTWERIFPPLDGDDPWL